MGGPCRNRLNRVGELYQRSLVMTHRDGFPRFSARSAWRGDAGHREPCGTPPESPQSGSMGEAAVPVAWANRRSASGSLDDVPHRPRLPSCPADSPGDLYGSLLRTFGIRSEARRRHTYMNAHWGLRSGVVGGPIIHRYRRRISHLGSAGTRPPLVPELPHRHEQLGPAQLHLAAPKEETPAIPAGGPACAHQPEGDDNVKYRSSKAAGRGCHSRKPESVAFLEHSCGWSQSEGA